MQNKKMTMETSQVPVYRGTRGAFAPKVLLVMPSLTANKSKDFHLYLHGELHVCRVGKGLSFSLLFNNRSHLSKNRLSHTVLYISH